jgi:hypothetical protein
MTMEQEIASLLVDEEYDPLAEQMGEHSYITMR